MPRVLEHTNLGWQPRRIQGGGGHRLSPLFVLRADVQSDDSEAPNRQQFSGPVWGEPPGRVDYKGGASVVLAVDDLNATAEDLLAKGVPSPPSL